MCVIATGTTFALSASTSVGRVTDVGNFKESVPRVDDNDLSTVGHAEYCPGTKIEHDEIDFGVVFDPSSVKALGTVETGTITFPVDTAAGHSSAATLAGTGFLMGRELGALENNERIEGSYTWTFDGKTGPAYTAGS